jgi:hypothetical protein
LIWIPKHNSLETGDNARGHSLKDKLCEMFMATLASEFVWTEQAREIMHPLALSSSMSAIKMEEICFLQFDKYMCCLLLFCAVIELEKFKKIN